MGKISAFLPFLLFIAMLHTVAATTISGTTYEWYSLEPLQNVILDINTIPRQTVVADNGSFSFDITEPGSYLIKAQYFEDNLLKYEANEVISVQGEGNFRLDLILFPSLENDDFLFDDFNELNVPIEPDSSGIKQDSILIYLILLAVAGIIFYLFITRRPLATSAVSQMPEIQYKEKGTSQDSNSGEKTSQSNNAERPTSEKELDEVIGIIKDYGGRITQKDLREKLPHSEAKVSLIVAELEHLGRIKKFKKGRGNIIVMKD